MPPSDKQRQATAARRSKAMDLALAGVNWQTIAERLEYASPGAAHTDVDRAIKTRAVFEAKVEKQRELEVLRLDRLQVAFWGDAVKGDTKAGDLVLKIIKQRARFTGTELPVKVNIDAQQLADEITALMDDMAGNDDTG